jgi:CRP/FNR family transcriptional regulator, cyclic AMP receptor protein
MGQQTLNRKVFHAGQVVFEEGEVGDRAFLVQKGTIEIVQKRGQADEVVRRVQAGEIFGAMSAIDEQPRIASARAAEESVCVIIPKPVFEQKIAASDPFIAALLRWFVSQSRGRAMH